MQAVARELRPQLSQADAAPGAVGRPRTCDFLSRPYECACSMLAMGGSSRASRAPLLFNETPSSLVFVPRPLFVEFRKAEQ